MSTGSSLADSRVYFTPTARRLGLVSAFWIASLLIAYAGTLAVGLATLPSPEQPIRGSLFATMEVLIIAMAPGLISLMVAVHAWAPPDKRSLSQTATIMMSIVAAITCTVHFTILSIGGHVELVATPWSRLVFSFEWPSLAYALDIAAWDLFFPLSMFFAAPVFSGTGRLATAVGALMIVSGALALAGLAGVIAGDMQLRNLGIVGYVGVFLIVVCLLAILFQRTAPCPPPRA